MTKKIKKESEQHHQLLTKGYQQGMSTFGNTRYDYNIFSVVSKSTYFKRIGNRRIVWDTVKKKFPAIGDIEVIDRGSGLTDVARFNKEANRVVRYNEFNNERRVDFYFPGLYYDFLPQELKIATGLDENKLIEVALSFNEPKTMKQLGKTLGYKNVTWLWFDKTSEKEQWNGDRLKVKHGEDAYGSLVSEGFPYTKSPMDNIMISGAIVSGTPKELQRFMDLEIVRASVIGATIDKY